MKSVKEQNIQRHDNVLQSPLSPDKNVYLYYILYQFNLLNCLF